MIRCRRWRVAVVVSLFMVAGVARAGKSEPESRAEMAFARIGPALVEGNYHQYQPFYGTVIAPHAVVASSGVVFCAFQDTTGRPVVMAYDPGKKQWTGPVHASSFGLGNDDHGNPSICLDRHDHIHVFYGCHAGPLRHARSRRPLDISEWEEQPAVVASATYPQSIRLADGGLFLFYRAGRHMEAWSASVSRDDGRTWSPAEKVIELRLDPPDRLAAAYASICPGAAGKSVHCFWVHKDDNAARVAADRPHPWRPLKYPGLHEAVYRYNMYYLRRDEAGAWRNAAGERVPLPVSKAHADRQCLVYDSGDELTNIGFPFVDEQNRPYVRFTTGVGDWKDGGRVIKPWHPLYVNYAEGAWHVHEEIPATWSPQARALAAVTSSAAFGPTAQEPWSIYYVHDRFNATSPTFLFLHHPDHGCATRPEGPAKLP